MKNFIMFVIIAALMVLLALIYESFRGAATLPIKNRVAIDVSTKLEFPCGAITSLDSLSRLGITNQMISAVLGTNDFSQTMWLFCEDPIDSVRIRSAMIFIVPANTYESNKLFFVAVPLRPHSYVKETAELNSTHQSLNSTSQP